MPELSSAHGGKRPTVVLFYKGPGVSMPSLTSPLLALPKPQSSARDPSTAIRVNLIESGKKLAWKTPLGWSTLLPRLGNGKA